MKFEECLVELVRIALHTKSTSIAVRIHLKNKRLQVIDNGDGISYDTLQQIGEYYNVNNNCSINMSKNKYENCHKLFISIRSITSSFIIMTNDHESYNTYQKIFREGVTSTITKIKNRPTRGTTYTVYFNFEENITLNILSWNKIKEAITNLSYKYPQVSFTIRSDDEQIILLGIRKNASHNILKKISNNNNDNNYNKCTLRKSYFLSEYSSTINQFNVSAYYLGNTFNDRKKSFFNCSNYLSLKKEFFERKKLFSFIGSRNQQKGNINKNVILQSKRSVKNNINNNKHFSEKNKCDITGIFMNNVINNNESDNNIIKSNNNISDCNKNDNNNDNDNNSENNNNDGDDDINVNKTNSKYFKFNINNDDNYDITGMLSNDNNVAKLSIIKIDSNIQCKSHNYDNNNERHDGNNDNNNTKENQQQQIEKITVEINPYDFDLSGEWSDWFLDSPSYQINNEYSENKNSSNYKKLMDNQKRYSFLPIKLNKLLRDYNNKLSMRQLSQDFQDKCSLKLNSRRRQDDDVRLCNVKRAMFELTMDKKILKQIKVLNQVNSEFIACVAELNNKKLLILIDQHAMDERIRYENLIEDYKTQDNKLISVTLKRSIKITELPFNYIKLLLLNRNLLTNFGINFSDNYKYSNNVSGGSHCNDGNKNTNNNNSEYYNNSILSVKSVPKCFLSKKYNSCIDLINSTRKLLIEIAEKLDQNISINSLPLTIHNIVASQACHGAIKFSDPLNLKQCNDLVSYWIETNLPNRCAHGRPVVIPLLFIDSSDKSKHNLTKKPLNFKSLGYAATHKVNNK